MTSSCEGYINNRPPADRPDSMQYYSCHDYTNTQNLGNNNYKMIDHTIEEPLEGPYTDFLNIYKIRNYDELFHAPICDRHYGFNTPADISIPEILNNEDSSAELLLIEEEYDRNAVKDPYYLYHNPRYIANKVTYSDETNDLFLMNHRSNDKDQLSHRLTSDQVVL